MFKRLDAEKSDRGSYKTYESDYGKNRPEVCETRRQEGKTKKKGEQTPALFPIRTHCELHSSIARVAYSIG
jgi:hypothetical protein